LHGGHSKPQARCILNAHDDQQAAGPMTLGEFGSKLKRSQEETRRLARAELVALRAGAARTEELERDRDALRKFLGECAARGLRRVDGPGEEQGLQDAPSRGHAIDLFSG
jgi:hypothetical protein